VVCDAEGGWLTLPAGFSLPAGTPAQVTTAIMWALGQLGTPYHFGGDCTAAHSGDPAHECDCSSLVQMAYRAAGVGLPRTAAEQSRVGILVADAAQLLPGDLLFVPGGDGTVADPGHVGLYVGGGLVLDAPHEGQVVHLARVTAYWLTDLVIRRVVNS
jgi:cell wall-associated NlpC family hydrolase